MTVLLNAYFLKITTKTGQHYGLTSLDVDTVIGGDLYYAAAAIDSDASSRKLGAEIDNVSISVLVNNTQIPPVIFLSGQLEDATATLSMLNFLTATSIFDGTVILTGRVGEITQTDTLLTFELLSTTERLNKGLTYSASPTCSFEFGGANCGLDLVANNWKRNMTITAIVPDVGDAWLITLAGASGLFFPEFMDGLVTFTSRENNGLVLRIIATNNTSQIRIPNTLITPILIGDTVTVTANCQRTKQACIDYNNFERFGGFLVGFGRGSSAPNWFPGIAVLTSANRDL
ncbi:MAG: baseplate hub protein [Waterburya sp.]